MEWEDATCAQWAMGYVAYILPETVRKPLYAIEVTILVVLKIIALELCLGYRPVTSSFIVF